MVKVAIFILSAFVSEKQSRIEAMAGPKIGISAEDWVKHWDTDFAEFSHQSHGHEHQDHHHHHNHHHHGHHHHGGAEEDERGCGSQKYLKKYLPKLTRDRPSVSLLVSLCGDSSDVAFLAGKGHDVIGIEIFEKAVKSIFTENQPPIPYSVTETGPFKVYTATDDKKIAIYVGNFFDTLPSDVGPFDAVWDGHGIVAIPEKDMQPYADKLKTLLKADGAMLFSTVWYDINELTKGPAPAPLSTDELSRFFPGCKVELLEKGPFDNSDFEGVTKATNDINLITKNQ